MITAEREKEVFLEMFREGLKIERSLEVFEGLVANLWRSREDGDFIFHVCGASLKAHRCILSAASPVFKAMLASGMSEGLSSSVSVDADPSELLVVLRFIYLGELDATGQQLPGGNKRCFCDVKLGEDFGRMAECSTKEL